MADEEIGARLRLRDRKKFSNDANRAARDVKDIGDKADRADKAGRRMGGGMGVAGAGVRGLTSVAKVGITAVAGLAAGVGVLAVKTVGLAMDAAETESKFNTVFAGMEDQVGSFVKQMNTDFGIPTKDLQDAASTFGVFGKAAGVAKEDLASFSTDLVTAGTDMASFYNAPVEDVFLALRSGLSGESEPLRQFGIFLSDASLNAFALEKGINKTTAQMSEQEKVALRQQFILANLGDAQGDLARTSGGLANQWKALKGRLTEAGTAIGNSLLPYAGTLVTMLNDKLAPAVTWLQDTLPGAVSATAAAVGGALERMRATWDAGGSYGETIASLTGIQAVEGPIDKVADVLGDLWTILRDGVIPAFQDVSSVVPDLLQPLTSLDDITGFLANNTGALRVVLVGLVGGLIAWKLANLAASAVLAVQTGLQKANTATLKAHIVQSKIARAATAVWAGAQWLLNAALTANPIGLIVLAIVALIAIFVLAWKHSETFRNIVTGAFNAVKNVVMGAFNWVRNNWPLLLAILTGPIGLAVLAIVKNWDTIKAGVAAVKDWVVEKFGQVVSFLTGLPRRINSAVRGMFDGIKDAFRGAINWIVDKWNGLEFTIGGITIDPPGPGSITIPSASLGTPNIPRLHSGGTTVTGGAVNMLPGEEIVVLPPAATVVPMSDDVRTMAAEMAAGGSRQPIVLQVVLDRKVLAEAVYNHTGDKVART